MGDGEGMGEERVGCPWWVMVDGHGARRWGGLGDGGVMGDLGDLVMVIW